MRDGNFCATVSNKRSRLHMRTLMAIATVRRLLRQLDKDGTWESVDSVLGPVEAWLVTPRDDLGGHTPIEALDQPHGERALSACLQAILGNQRNDRC